MNSAPDSETLTICLLDDEVSTLKATGRLLSSAGWQSKSFSDPIAFLRYAEAHSPSVAVIDLLMPRMNGLEVQRRLHKVSRSTRVIVLTGRDDPSLRTQALSAGVFAFFLKGTRDEEFLSAIESAASWGLNEPRHEQ